MIRRQKATFVAMSSLLKNKTVLITGGTGSWGTELTKQLLKNNQIKEIRIFSRGEFAQTEMRRNFDNHKKLQFFIGDIRDLSRLLLVSRGVDYIFHFAALKHVPVCENHPTEAVQTNIYGTQNVIESAVANNVVKVIYATSDKGVDPINLYGITKACAERLVVAANELSSTKFICLRAGNIIETRGSVIPLFSAQISSKNCVTLTHSEMTRFYISLSDIIKFMLNAALEGKGGEVFITKAPSVSTMSLAKLMVKTLGNKNTKIKLIGSRAGEKIHELLISTNEFNRVFELKDYFVVLPSASPRPLLNFYAKRGKLINSGYGSHQNLVTDENEIKKIFNDSLWLKQIAGSKKNIGEDYFKREGWLMK